MGSISVAEAAVQLSVGVSRIHQRIADGSLRAERIGSQWVIDEESVSAMQDSGAPGRPLSKRSAWALLALSRGDQPSLDALAPAERSRARKRLGRLLANVVSDDPLPEVKVHAAASLLRAWLGPRAERAPYRASPRDLPDLHDDDRVVLSGVGHPRSGIASGEIVEGYLSSDDIDVVVQDYLLSRADSDKDANVVFHVVDPVYSNAVADISPLLLAADLAEHRRPREQARAIELLRQLAEQNPALVAATTRATSHERSARDGHAGQVRGADRVVARRHGPA